MRMICSACLVTSIGCSSAFAQLKTERIADGLTRPLFLTATGTDPRLFVVEKDGLIKVWENGSILPDPFLDLSSLVNTADERGLLGMAFAPGFNANGQFYVNYTDAVSQDTIIARYHVSLTDVNLANPSSGEVIIQLPQPAGQAEHKAGWIGFRPGEPENLYIAAGDSSGTGNDPGNVAQNIDSKLGKILRIDVSGPSGYSIPSGNPFVGQLGDDLIWAYGLRNPFRDSFDRQTGDFYIADVGQENRDEINFEAASNTGGENYGWRAREGSDDNPAVPDPAPANAVDPIVEIVHPSGPASITGGYVYRGNAMPGLDGTYFYGDFINDKIYSFRYDGSTVLDHLDRTAELANFYGVDSISSFGEDSGGELYIVDFGGEVFKIVQAPGPGTVPDGGTTIALLGCAVLGLGTIRRRIGA